MIKNGNAIVIASAVATVNHSRGAAAIIFKSEVKFNFNIIQYYKYNTNSNRYGLYH